MGGEPKTAMNLVGFPDDKLELDWLGKILEGGGERCKTAGVVIVGGHTVRDAEIKFGLSVTGIIHPQRILTNASARPGDKLVLTKALGTGFVTTAHRADACPEELFQVARESMIQLNAGGRDAMIAVGVHSATDITGFGLAGHAYEMAEGSNVTLTFSLSQLPLLPGVEALVKKGYFTRASKTNREYVASRLRIEGKPDPGRLEIFYDAQTSGGLLVSVPADRADRLVAESRARGAAVACVVGEVRERKNAAEPFLIVRE